MHVRWDEGAAVTPHGQLVFFAEFLAATGVFDRWVSSCPLALPQRQRSGQARRAGHADAGPAGRAHAAMPTSPRCAATPWPRRPGHEQSRQRRRAAPGAGAHGRSGQQRLDAPRADALRARGAGQAVGAGHRRQHQAAVWAPGRRRDGLQPASPGGPATCCTPSGWATCAWCWTCRSARASSTPAAMPRPRWGGCSTNWATSARRWCAATPATATKASCWTLEQRDQPYLLRLRQTANVSAWWRGVRPPGLEPARRTRAAR